MNSTVKALLNICVPLLGAQEMNKMNMILRIQENRKQENIYIYIYIRDVYINLQTLTYI